MSIYQLIDCMMRENSQQKETAQIDALNLAKLAFKVLGVEATLSDIERLQMALTCAKMNPNTDLNKLSHTQILEHLRENPRDIFELPLCREYLCAALSADPTLLRALPWVEADIAKYAIESGCACTLGDIVRKDVFDELLPLAIETNPDCIQNMMGVFSTQTEEHVLSAIASAKTEEKLLNVLKTAHLHTKKICKTAAYTFPEAIRGCSIQTEEMQQQVVNQNSALLRWCINPSSETIDIAIAGDATAIRFARNPTVEQCRAALKADFCNLAHIRPEHLQNLAKIAALEEQIETRRNKIAILQQQ